MLKTRTPLGLNRRKRPVLLHYHTFKNAGSTIDACLQRCFPNAWANFDGPVPEFFIHHSELEIIARNRPHLKAMSSHQIRLPVPVCDDIEFLPIVFIRRPELRLASIWRFQRQRTDEHPATTKAQALDFRSWLKELLDAYPVGIPQYSQAHLFSFNLNQRTKRDDDRISEYAMRNITSLPLVGIVERFDESMNAFTKLYSQVSAEFTYEPIKPVNVTWRATGKVDHLLNELEHQIGCDLLDQVRARYATDVLLYERSVAALNQFNNDGV